MPNGRKYYIMEERVKERGVYITRNIRYIGTANRLLSDLIELDKYRKKKR